MSLPVISWDPGPERADAWLVDLTCECGHKTQQTVTEPRAEVPPCVGCGKRGPIMWSVRSVVVGPSRKVPGGLIA